MTSNGLVGIIGFTLANTSNPQLAFEIKATFTLSSVVTAYAFQERVQKSGPALVATLYAIPELYLVLFFAYHVVNGGWIGIAILLVLLWSSSTRRTLPIQNVIQPQYYMTNE
ncbi:hypothetical protein DL96DRAFT_1566773 [Flagelloscypha sp. PMI_526]|nr:hypothetical protein DL96DRAFT_1566773 [Flagelloscypha sp. PMI_526]